MTYTDSSDESEWEFERTNEDEALEDDIAILEPSEITDVSDCPDSEVEQGDALPRSDRPTTPEQHYPHMECIGGLTKEIESRFAAGCETWADKRWVEYIEGPGDWCDQQEIEPSDSDTSEYQVSQGFNMPGAPRIQTYEDRVRMYESGLGDTPQRTPEPQDIDTTPFGSPSEPKRKRDMPWDAEI